MEEKICQVKREDKEEFKRLVKKLNCRYKYIAGPNWKVYIENSFKYLDCLVLGKWIRKNCKHPSCSFEVKDVKIHIGQDISTNITSAMLAAKERVYIASPYVSDKTMQFFDFVANEVEDCKILFSTKSPDEKKKENIYKRMVEYLRVEDEDKIKKRNENIKKLEMEKEKISKESHIIWIFIFVAIAVGAFLGIPKLLEIQTSYGVIGGILFLLAMFRSLSHYFSKKNKKAREIERIEKEIANEKNVEIGKIVYRMKNTEKYRCIFENNERPRRKDDLSKFDFPELAFSHIKLYIIDNVAFLGSMNFTPTSFSNLESLIEIRDKDTVDKLAKYFLDELYRSNKFHTKVDISQELGKKLYPEEKMLSEARKNKLQV